MTSASPTCPLCESVALPEDRFGDAPLLRCDDCDFTFLAGETDATLCGDHYFAVGRRLAA